MAKLYKRPNFADFVVGVQVAIVGTKALLRSFRKFQKVSSYLSVRMEQLGSHLTDIHEVLYLRMFRKSVEKVQV
jgi:hypothetical protein